MPTSAKVIADSLSPDGIRLTTMQATGHRFILSEFNTHRRFSRNSASSRAIPLEKQIAKVLDDPAIPVSWPKEQKGMQGGEELSVLSQANAQDEWSRARKAAIESAQTLGEIKVHKSVVNRLLEPFMWHTIVVTSTAWENFFEQRCSPLAQPEIRVMAEMMRDAMAASEPMLMAENEWHLPYMDGHTRHEVALSSEGDPEEDARILAMISAARCARVSYLTQEGTRDIEADIALYERLVTARPAHWSPLEHVATPWAWNRQEGCIHFGSTEKADHQDFTCIPLDGLPRTGNLLGWRSLRTTIEAEQGQVTWL